MSALGHSPLMLVLARGAVVAALASPTGLALPLGLFHADEGASRMLPAPEGLTIHGWEHAYIAPPGQGVNRSEWLAAAREYRQQLRRGEVSPVLQMDYDGVRAWTRTDMHMAQALDLRPGEMLEVRVNGRCVQGNDELCAAFDIHHRDSGLKAGWTGVVETLNLPREHSPEWRQARVRVPEFDASRFLLRPILGMDATHDPTRGRLEIAGLDLSVGDPERMTALQAAVARALETVTQDSGPAPRTRPSWVTDAFTCHFTFLYDSRIYDPRTGRYTLDRFLDDGLEQFGGYDVLILWHAYPRIGVDERNQVDFYRDMPGGLEGLRELVADCHRRGVRVFINYNPWDGGTGREQGTDEDMLETLVDGLGIDGVFLDTMHGDELPDLHARLARIRPDIVLCPEGAPPLEAMPHCDASWAQGQLDDPAYSPSLILRKWLEPAHMTWQIWRWQTDHREEIRRAFFNGTGMLVWENVFGVHNPWSPTDRHLWRRAVRILRFFQTHFASDAWDPYIPSGLTPERLARLGWQAHEVPEVRVHRRPGDRGTVYTFSAKGFHHEHGLHFHHTQWPLLELPDKPGMAYFDLWNGRTMTPRQDAPGTVCLWGRLDHNSGLGCILAVPESQVDDALLALIAAQSAAAAEMPAATPDRDRVLDTTAPVVPDLRRRSDRPEPAGMVRVAGGPVHVRLDHPRRECGCYPDPGTPRDLRQAYTWGSPFTGRVSHDFEVEVEAFWIDECEVSNADFERFLAESGYVPTEPRNFLKHWTDGRMPAEVAELPVVFVDLDDARAYARWAGKRLPTEWEWQVAAQGRDGRAWPWGDEFDPERCAPDHGPVPVRSMPRGRSPWGCYHMAGNVWEWTESCRDDGHTRFAMIRGGSWYRAEGSGWYVEGGPQPCTSHTKFIRMWPGLDRCATVGFRCAMDDGPGVVPADR